jgi:SAM-dependent methyltransferase
MSTPAAPIQATPFDDGLLYDLAMGEIDYGLDFYRGLARSAGGPILEVCCGTGRVLLPLLRDGLDADGLDLAPALLDRLRDKAAAQGLQPHVHLGDMCSFRLDRRYALILITGNAFVHNLTTEDQIRTLSCCREHLQPGGRLAFDAFFPGAAYLAADGHRVLECEIRHPETGLPVRFYDNRTMDRVEQQQHSINEIEFLDTTGAVAATHRNRTTTRWIYKGEMALLLRVAGFGRWEIYGGFDRQPLTKDTDGMVVEAWNSPAEPA